MKTLVRDVLHRLTGEGGKPILHVQVACGGGKTHTLIAAFLHFQPSGQRADAPELYSLLAHPALDPLALTEGLKKWRDLSWFLVDDPAAWALSTTV